MSERKWSSQLDFGNEMVLRHAHVPRVVLVGSKYAIGSRALSERHSIAFRVEGGYLYSPEVSFEAVYDERLGEAHFVLTPHVPLRLAPDAEVEK